MQNKSTASDILELSAKSFKNNFSTYMSLAAIFIIAIFLLGFLMATSGVQAFQAILFMGLLGFVYAKLAVAVHRSVLLSDQSLGELLRFKSADVKFFLAMLVVFVSLFVVFWLFTMVFVQSGLIILEGSGSAGLLTILLLIVFIVVGVIGARLALVFPAIAINDDIDFSQIWQKTHNHKAKLFFLIIVIPYISSRLMDLISEDSLFLSILGAVVSVLVVMFEVVILSHCYREIMGDQGEEQEWVQESVD
ncbi:MAG: hypothetical protein ACK5L8_01195 [Marinicella pacifica]